MKDQLTEKYEQVLESEQEPKLWVTNDGMKEWHIGGVLHRLDGPAVIYPSGTKIWFVRGLRHRLDGPAIEGANGQKEWWVNGMLHRLDGPAIIDSVLGREEWWINDEQYSKEGFDKYIARLKEIEKGSEEAGANLDF